MILKNPAAWPSHLRFGKKPINKPYLVTRPTFVACHRQAYVNEYDILQGIEEGGTFLLNCTWTPEELNEKLPAAEADDCQQTS